LLITFSVSYDSWIRLCFTLIFGILFLVTKALNIDIESLKPGFLERFKES